MATSSSQRLYCWAAGASGLTMSAFINTQARAKFSRSVGRQELGVLADSHSVALPDGVGAAKVLGGRLLIDSPPTPAVSDRATSLRSGRSRRRIVAFGCAASRQSLPRCSLAMIGGPRACSTCAGILLGRRTRFCAGCAPKRSGSDPRYGSRQWKRTVLAVKRRDGWRCQHCGATERLVVDHRTPHNRYPGSFFDPTNLLDALRGA